VWTKNGNSLIPNEENKYDLMEFFAFKDKEPIWCWDDADTAYRALRFWDAKNNKIFDYSGERTGVKYTNYARVKYIEKWMFKAQKQLKD